MTAGTLAFEIEKLIAFAVLRPEAEVWWMGDEGVGTVLSIKVDAQGKLWLFDSEDKGG